MVVQPENVIICVYYTYYDHTRYDAITMVWCMMGYCTISVGGTLFWSVVTWGACIVHEVYMRWAPSGGTMKEERSVGGSRMDVSRRMHKITLGSMFAVRRIENITALIISHSLFGQA